MTVEIIEAEAEDHDAILLDRVAAWAAAGPTSFLRANKPDWRLEVERHRPPLSEAEADAVADSALVLELIASGRPKREIVLRAMRRLDDALELSPEERVRLHRDGHAWALSLGRWGDEGMEALSRRFDQQRAGIEALLAAPCDAASEARWRRVTRAAAGPEEPIALARRLIGHHANRLGVFAEAEAILHYFLFRLDSGPPGA